MRIPVAAVLALTGLCSPLIVGDVQAAVVCTAAGFGCPAAGTCTISGTWDVQDGAECALDFGDRDVVVKGMLRAQDSGGSITIAARSLTLDGGVLRAPGGVDASGGSITIETSGVFAMRGGGARIAVEDVSQGGTVDVMAGSIEIATGSISATATGTGGDAGSLSLWAMGDVTVRGEMEASGPRPNGYGGGIAIASEEGRVTIGAALTVDGQGAESLGGEIALTAAMDVVIDGNLTASGGLDGGPGTITLVSGAGVDVRNGRIVRVRGGTVSSTSSGSLVVRGTVDVSGRTGEAGGAVDVEHCSIAIAGTLDARGGAGASAGTIAVNGGTISVGAAGKLLATPCIDGACNQLTVRTETGVVIDPAARIEPAADVWVDEYLFVCCGNGVVDPGETCDDGGFLYCDGCTPSCTLEPAVPCPEDGNPCTGGCVPAVGCELLDGAACESDGDPCTDDVCQAGACTHPSPCDAASVSQCRHGECTPEGCVFENLPDSTACELAGWGGEPVPSFCLAGACHNPCDDGDPCTRDVPAAPGYCWSSDYECPATCQGRPDGARCSDGDSCTRGTCEGGVCVSSAVVCSPCQGSVCLPSFGCLLLSEQCEDDGDPCTAGVCDAVAGGCRAVPLTGASCLDDGDACTADVCDAGVCTHVALGCGTSTTSTSSTTTVATSSTTSTTTTVPPGEITLIRTTRLVLEDHQGSPPDPSGRRVVFRSRTRGEADANRIRVPPRGSAGDPTPDGGAGGGATLVVYNAAGTGESVLVPLDASAWTADARSPIPKGYRYTGAPGSPISRVVLKADALRVKGGGVAWVYTLDEEAQGRVAVRLTLGDGTTWCAEAPGTIDRAGRFVATRRSPVLLACPEAP